MTTLVDSLRQPGTLWLLLFVASYKVGEELVDPMLRPFLIDAGYKKEQLSLWIGSYGMLASLTGSILGGFMASRMPLLTAVAVSAAMRAFSVGGEWYLTILVHPGPTAIKIATIAEHFCGGALTTAMFAYMMSRVNKAVGGTHYTLLACVEVIGKWPPSLLSGVLADRLGYREVFGIGTMLSFLFLLLLIPLRRAQAAEVAAST
jgi:predicted MFS family arabinose efflux permease